MEIQHVFKISDLQLELTVNKPSSLLLAPLLLLALELHLIYLG